MSARIREHFRSLGYDEVAFDPRGFRSGSLNEAIPVTISK
jgi:PP-loop superfamily ATP-utilizing enzyme